MPEVKLVALLVGEPHAIELYTLRRLTAISSQLSVVQAENGSGLAARQRLLSLVRQHGIAAVVSRVLAGRLLGSTSERRMHSQLARLLDEPSLQRWWDESGLKPVIVPHLNHEQTRIEIAALRPDIIVRVSGGVLRRRIFAEARVAALNIHHGMAPRIRGMWSIPWGIVEGRRDWIGATVHEIDDGIDTGRVFWRGAPQVAPGDTATTLFFRAHLEAVEALTQTIRGFASGRQPATMAHGESETSTYRSAAGLWAWARFIASGEGRRSRTILEGAIHE